MAQNIDKLMKSLAAKYNEGDKEALKLMKQILDDIYLIFCGTSKNLHKYFEEVNKINPTIQLTMSHTTIPEKALEDCEQMESISFLDT